MKKQKPFWETGLNPITMQKREDTKNRDAVARYHREKKKESFKYNNN